MKKPIPVEYLFMFESDSPWRNVYDFERDLGTFFSERGINAETNSMFEGFAGKKIIWLSRKEQPILSAVSPSTEKSSAQEPGQSTKQLIQKMLKK